MLYIHHHIQIIDMGFLTNYELNGLVAIGEFIACEELMEIPPENRVSTCDDFSKGQSFISKPRSSSWRVGASMMSFLDRFLLHFLSTSSYAHALGGKVWRTAAGSVNPKWDHQKDIGGVQSAKLLENSHWKLDSLSLGISMASVLALNSPNERKGGSWVEGTPGPCLLA